MVSEIVNNIGKKSVLFLFVCALVGGGCVGSARNVPGTEVADNSTNRGILRTLERYRLAVEKQDVASLILMASPKYWEDGGTTSGRDDYGYKELHTVLAGRFRRSEAIRYALRYMNIRQKCPPDHEDRLGCVAYVTVLIDASYTIRNARGRLARMDKRDQNQFVLEWTGKERGWQFLTGM